jgi:eukaryotic-like serine/threonine-protein kinase
MHAATIGLAPGTHVDDFVVDEHFRDGGFASVYRASRSDGVPVALKVLRSEFVRAAETLARFQREAETIVALDHPGIVKVYTHGVLPTGQPWIAMEWLAGESLDRLLALRGRLTLAEALEVMAQVAGALDAAHAQGVIHRDVKAQNVVTLAERGPLLVKVVDFGIAHLTGPELRMTTTGDVLGTPATMPPEQIRGEAVDARADVYACGCLLFQLLTGRLPFLGATRMELEDQHLYAPPPSLARLTGLPETLDAVVARALAKDRSARPSSAGTWLAEVQRAAGRTVPEEVWALRVEILLEGDDDALWDQATQTLARALALAETQDMTAEYTDATTLLALGRAEVDVAALETQLGPSVRVRSKRGTRAELLRADAW